jgi:transcriptional regulator with XRE-family HTH domain
MNSTEIQELGAIIRKIRKEKGWRLEDLADENISPATISNIERGVASVKHDKVHYLLQKMNIDYQDLPHRLAAKEREFRELEFQLDHMDYLWKLGKYKEVIRRVNLLKLPDNHLLAPMAYYMKGKSLLLLQKWEKADIMFDTALRLCNRNGHDKRDNVEASCLVEKGMSCYYLNRVHEALNYTEKALLAFVDGGKREHVKYVAVSNKLIFLERLDRIGEGLNYLHEVWYYIDKIKNIDVLFTMYWVRAELLRRSNLFESAISYAEEGLNL